MKLSTLKRWSFSLLLLLTSCRHETLFVQSEYLTASRYASLYVGSPDVRKFCPSLGQRLIVEWRVREHYTSLTLKMRMRLKNYQEFEKVIPLTKMKGRFIYNLMDEEYFSSGGFMCYRVELYGDGCLLAESVHQLWSELIVLDPVENLEENLPWPDETYYQDQIRDEGTGFYDIP